MKCVDLENLAIDYVDGTLAAGARTSLETHLSVCVPCAARLREFSGDVSHVGLLLDSWPTIQPSASFDQMVLQRIRSQEPATISPATSSATSPVASWWSRFAAAFLAPLARPALSSALAVVMIAAFSVVRYFPGSTALDDSGQTGGPVVAILDSYEDIALYQDLPVLEDWEMLRNFEVLQDEVLQEMKGSTP